MGGKGEKGAGTLLGRATPVGKRRVRMLRGEEKKQMEEKRKKPSILRKGSGTCVTIHREKGRQRTGKKKKKKRFGL